MKEQSFGPITFIPGPNKGRYPHCHSIYIEDAGVIIDSASNRDRLIELNNNKLIKMVWLTHWHEDHIMHLNVFNDLPLWIGEQDAPPLGDLETFLDWYKIDDIKFREEFSILMKEQFNFMPRKPDRLLKDGELIDLGELTVEIIHIPGHTPGHLAFFFREPEVLLMGDIDLTPFGPWYGDSYSSVEETISSIKRMREVPAKIWLTCHEKGVFQNNPGELWDNYLEVIQIRENKLLRVLEKNPTMEDIIDEWIIYGKPREPRSFYQFGERANMSKHLESLIRRGVVQYENGCYQII